MNLFRNVSFAIVMFLFLCNAPASAESAPVTQEVTSGASTTAPATARTTPAGAGATTPSETAGSDADGKPAIPELAIGCVHIFDRHALYDPAREAKNTVSDDPSAVNQIPCPATRLQTLIGSGDVGVFIDDQQYKQLQTYYAATGAHPTLYVNGIDLGTDAPLIGIQRAQGRAMYYYSLQPGVNSKKLWAMLYRAGKATTTHPMQVALGFSSGPASYGTTGDSVRIAITTSPAFWFAMAAIVLLVGLTAFLGKRTDIFRDAKTPAAFARALADRRAIASGKAQLGAVLAALDKTYVPVNDQLYEDMARKALAGDVAGHDPDKLALGLILLRDKWRSGRPSYSLGRVQLGMWFLFAVATGIFLWVVYGQLPELDGSLLALLGLSVGVTGCSLAIDKGNPAVGFIPSEGLFKDLTTSWNEQHQVYRFQAVVVNLLLLGVGIIHVSRHLTYPIFDATWLAFLGISGAALVAGKSAVEST